MVHSKNPVGRSKNPVGRSKNSVGRKKNSEPCDDASYGSQKKPPQYFEAAP
jgi:hypothetical protein